MTIFLRVGSKGKSAVDLARELIGGFGGLNRMFATSLADFSAVERGQRDGAIQAAVQRYADSLTRLCQLAPYNWFNFFDFWQKK